MISCIFHLDCKANAANLKWNSVFIQSIGQESESPTHMFPESPRWFIQNIILLIFLPKKNTVAVALDPEPKQDIVVDNAAGFRAPHSVITLTSIRMMNGMLD